MALPPDAVFEAVMVVVSRADASAGWDCTVTFLTRQAKRPHGSGHARSNGRTAVRGCDGDSHLGLRRTT